VQAYFAVSVEISVCYSAKSATVSVSQIPLIVSGGITYAVAALAEICHIIACPATVIIKINEYISNAMFITHGRLISRTCVIEIRPFQGGFNYLAVGQY
jgi:membrane protein YdbS with pleckstrin-like domain